MPRYTSTANLHSLRTRQPEPSQTAGRAIRFMYSYKTDPGEPPEPRTNGTPSQVKIKTIPWKKTNKALDMEQSNKHERLSNEVTRVPNPIPDTGERSTTFPEYPALPGPTNHVTAMNNSILPSPVFSALPPLLSRGPTITHTNQVTSAATMTSSLATNSVLEPASGAMIEQHGASQSHKLSTLVVVLLAVGSFLILAGICIVIRFCTRPTRRPRPTPSLPILNDPFSNESRFQGKDSPVFGGKERDYTRPGSNDGPWTWTQYSQPTSAIPKQTKTSSKNPIDNPYEHNSFSRLSHLQGSSGHTEHAQYHFSGPMHTQSGPNQVSQSSPFRSSMQQAQHVFPRTMNRISKASVSFYAKSSPETLDDVGIAAGGPTNGMTSTVDGRHVPQRTGSMILENSNSDCENGGVNRHSQGAAYDGAAISSPVFTPYTITQPNKASSRGGRTRIKSSYYTVGSYPRISNSTSKKAANPPHQLHQASVWKSDPHRDRDTQALTYALGLSSPMTEYTTPSPHTTLYPDDSLSVVDARNPRKPSIKKTLSSKARNNVLIENQTVAPVITTVMDPSSALGSLMLVDFDGGDEKNQVSQKRRSIPSNPAGSTIASPPTMTNGTPKKIVLRSGDKAPYIPLPPPLPSLTQMGLEHANPQAYADYSSPTYSIYGLYESNRKSGVDY